MLIDDNKATNYLNREVIEDMDLCNEVILAGSAKEALTFLTTKTKGKYPCPELIFLDLNMPAIDGWHVIDEFSKINQEAIKYSHIVLLTASKNPTDEIKIGLYPLIKGYYKKPLVEETVQEVVNSFLKLHKGDTSNL